MEKIAMYPGTFNPFTNGHLAILESAAQLFDKVYLVIAVNTKKEKRSLDELNQMYEAIAATCKIKHLDNVTVIGYMGLIADFAEKNNVKYVIRGLRNSTDYCYEENLRLINKELNPDLEYIYIPTSSVISSSMVRELIKYNCDISKYVPPAIEELYLV